MILPYIIMVLVMCAMLGVLLWPLRHAPRLCMVIAAITLPLAFLLYQHLGSPAILPLLATHERLQQDARTRIATESEIVKNDPKNLEAWIRLGQAFAAMRQWKPAANAFKQSVLLTDGQPELIMAYARAMIMDEDGKVSDHSKQSLDMVLLQKPEHPEARYYMNVRLLQDGKTEDAMKAMKELYTSLPDDSPVKAMINAQIGRN